MPRGFTDAVTMSMQKEALRRVREMQRQAQQSIGNSRQPFGQGQGEKPWAIPPEPPKSQSDQQYIPRGNDQRRNDSPPFHNSGSPQDILSRILGGKAGELGSLGETLQSTIASASQPAAELLKSFGIDGEKLIIMMIMWAVFNEHKDNKLLLMALGYLLL